MRLSVLLVVAGMLSAQEPSPEKKQTVDEAQIITVKTLTGDSFERLMKLLSVFNARYSGDSQLRTILVYGSKDVVAQMRHVVEQLDRPGSEAAIGRNIDLTLTLLRCSSKPGATPSALPTDMESVARQLRAATQYKQIELLDVVPMRLQEGKEATEDLRLPGTYAAGQPARASIRLLPEAVYRKDQGRYVRFARIDVNLGIPVATGTFQAGPAAAGVSPLVNTQFTYSNVGLKTSGDFMEGQKTVLGKISGLSDEDAIFAVIMLKVLD